MNSEEKKQVKVSADDIINYVGYIFYYALFTTILSSLLQTEKVLKSVFLKQCLLNAIRVRLRAKINKKGEGSYLTNYQNESRKLQFLTCLRSTFRVCQRMMQKILLCMKYRQLSIAYNQYQNMRFIRCNNISSNWYEF